jgi:choline dehydrogenase-like flavoprotein
VERLETDANGHSVTRVHVNHRSAPETYSADIVVVSCGATNSAALLLKSASDKHPRGLANSSDTVGRHYMAHIHSGVIAISETPNTTRFQKTLGINDYYWGAEDSELPLGHIQMLGKSDKDILRAGAPWFAPSLALEYMARHAIDFWMTTNAHQCGTVRFGSDPSSSALDVDCRAHDVDNLYVVDTSFFPSSGAVNPALTAMANALRVGDHLLERLAAHVEAAPPPHADARPVEVLS